MVNDKSKTGGIFEVRDKTPLRATLIFRGWNADTSRNAMQQIPIERGGEDSIEMAIVNKMIELSAKKPMAILPDVRNASAA